MQKYVNWCNQCKGDTISSEIELDIQKCDETLPQALPILGSEHDMQS